MESVALQRWILVEGDIQDACEGERRINNERLLKPTDERWEADRPENADAKKKPPLDYEEWAAIDRAIGREVNNRNALGERENEWGMSRWETWGMGGSQRMETVSGIGILSPATTGA